MKIHFSKVKNPIDLLDKVITLIGIAFIIYGIKQIYSPAAWIVLGVILAWPGMPRRAVK